MVSALQKHALVTKEKVASPLDFDPSYRSYWSMHFRDAVFGANTNALHTKFTGFSYCFPEVSAELLCNLVDHALCSALSTKTPTATFILLPDTNNWKTHGCYAALRTHPEHAYTLAQFPPHNLKLPAVEAWFDSPHPAKTNDNHMRLIVIWNNSGKHLLYQNDPAWLQKLQQAIPEATWTRNTQMLTSYINPAKPKCSKTRRIRFHLLHPDSHNCIITRINKHNNQRDLHHQFCQPHNHKIQEWRTLTYTDGSVVADRESSGQITGAGLYTPLSNTGHSMEHTVLPNGHGPTNTINRAELSAILVALSRGCKDIATDSAGSLFQ